MFRRLTLLVALAALPLLVPAGANATFPGGNGKIAFTSTVPSAPNPCVAVFTINPDGSGRTQVSPCTSGFDDNATYPSWSPDGKTIAFASDDAVILIAADGTGEHAIFGNKGPVAGLGWSPDGAKLVVANFAEPCGICGIDYSMSTINADGSGRQVLEQGFIDESPDWSPTGSPIAYTRFGDPFVIYTINPDGTGSAPLAQDAGWPSWSPDGTKIAFDSTRDGDSEIFSMNADGSGQTQLTFDPALDSTPAWSPDGTKIAFVSTRSGARQIYVMNAGGSAQTRVTNSNDFESLPDWQPAPGPRRADFKNSAQFCKAEQEFLGDAAFRHKYGGGPKAHGKCVSAH
jgi:Tol biopolymer transport system component